MFFHINDIDKSELFHYVELNDCDKRCSNWTLLNTIDTKIDVRFSINVLLTVRTNDKWFYIIGNEKFVYVVEYSNVFPDDDAYEE